MPDKNWLATPFDGDNLTQGNIGYIHLGRGRGKRRGIGVHLVNERPNRRSRRDGADSAGSKKEKISASRFADGCRGQDQILELRCMCRIAVCAAFMS
jgi:hypothetical protein